MLSLPFISFCSAFWLSWGHCCLVEEVYFCFSAVKLSVSPEQVHWGALLPLSWRIAVGDLKAGLAKLWVLMFRLLLFGFKQTRGWKKQGCTCSLDGRTCRKRPLAMPAHGWEESIKINVSALGQASMQWICLSQDEEQWWGPMNTIMNLRFPLTL